MAVFSAVKYGKQTACAMRRVIDYVEQERKTIWEGRQLITGLNCVAQCAYDEMMLTKQHYQKADGILFYHFAQAFHPEEAVTPQEVHAIGLELAQRLFPGHEVVVATHVDADHLHNHFLVNSVNCETGRKLHQNAADLQRQRQTNDQLCMAHGLQVLEPAKRYGRRKDMKPGEYRSAAKGQSWKFQLMNSIDLCMRRAKTKQQFIAEMERRGYRVRWEAKRKYITYTTPQDMKCRDDRLHDEKYRKDVMEHEFRIRAEMLARRIEAEELAAGDAVTCGNGTCGDRSNRCSVGDTVEYPGQSRHGTVGSVSSAVGTDGYDAGTSLGYAGDDLPNASTGNRRSGDGGSVQTGWEGARAEAFTQAFRHREVVGAADPHVQGSRDHADSIGDIKDAVVHLGHRLEQSAEPIPAAVPVTGHSDHKVLAKEREKKIALGHKPDDHQEDQGMRMTMR